MVKLFFFVFIAMLFVASLQQEQPEEAVEGLGQTGEGLGGTVERLTGDLESALERNSTSQEISVDADVDTL